jgi:hypothetical protein
MRDRVIVPCLLLVWLASGQQPQVAPDAGKVTNNTFESTFFKFQYSFPAGWSAVDDDVRSASNRKRHADWAEKVKRSPLPTPVGRNPSTQALWTYDLLTATPKPLAADGKPVPPCILAWAIQASNVLKGAADLPKHYALHPGVRVLRQPAEITIAGRKFVRADFVLGDNSFEAMFVTVAGDYHVGFDIRGKTESEMNELAATMQTIKFN